MPHQARSALVPVVLLIAAAFLPQELGAQACTISQITDSTVGNSFGASLDGGSIAFVSTADLDPSVGNADGNNEIFLFDGVSISQITDSTAGNSFEPSLDGGSIAFYSTADLDPGVGNADGNDEIFLFDGVSISQITDSTAGDSLGPSLDGGSIAFVSTADLDPGVGNADGNFEIFLFDCASPSVLEIPTLDGWALCLLALAMAGLGLRRLIGS